MERTVCIVVNILIISQRGEKMLRGNGYPKRNNED